MKEFKKLERKIETCKKCDLWKFRKNAVAGEGPINAKIFFLGQAPGRTEDLTGRPFVGPAGKFLDKLLEIAGIKREKVFITGSVKCFPPKNRKPTVEEIEACKPYLLKQIETIKPKLIVLLGEVALYTLLGMKERVTNLHGKILKKDKFVCFITFHPAAGMRFPKIRKMMIRDFKKLGILCDKI
jgi:DNA polymerase